jgi:hypothetical protein
MTANTAKNNPRQDESHGRPPQKKQQRRPHGAVETQTKFLLVMSFVDREEDAAVARHVVIEAPDRCTAEATARECVRSLKWVGQHVASCDESVLDTGVDNWVVCSLEELEAAPIIAVPTPPPSVALPIPPPPPPAVPRQRAGQVPLPPMDTGGAGRSAEEQHRWEMEHQARRKVQDEILDGARPDIYKSLEKLRTALGSPSRYSKLLERLVDLTGSMGGDEDASARYELGYLAGFARALDYQPADLFFFLEPLWREGRVAQLAARQSSPPSDGASSSRCRATVRACACVDHGDHDMRARHISRRPAESR